MRLGCYPPINTGNSTFFFFPFTNSQVGVVVEETTLLG